MRRFIAFCCCVLSAAAMFGAWDPAYEKEVEKAQQWGAKAKAVFRVLDDKGDPVPGAEVQVWLWVPYRANNGVEGITDERGFFTAEGRGAADLHYIVKKEGHYATDGRYWLYNQSRRCVAGGKWIPYGQTNTVVLKRKLNPIAMYVGKSPRDYEAKIPARDVPVGLDLVKGDWVAPYGKGVETDILFRWSFFRGTNIWDARSELSMSFTNAFCGACVRGKDLFSEFRSVYRADPGAAYAREFRFLFDCTGGGIVRTNTFLPKDKYMVFRCRAKTKGGRLAGARYGKIYGEIDVMGDGTFTFQYYLNPDENDTNLEADSSRNLLNPSHEYTGFEP